MDLQLKGKVAIITGGTHGIGKAAALSLSREGALVAIAARTETDLNSASKDITNETGNEVIGVLTDVRNESMVENLINTVVKKWGRIDIVVNNAGTSSAYKLEDMTNEILTEDLELKVYGAIYCIRHALKHLKASGNGSIINITTPGGKHAITGPGGQPTSLSRAAGISLTKSWSKEFSQYNIRVNTICVGILKSRQNRNKWKLLNQKDPKYTLDKHWQSVSTGVPLGRVGEAMEAGDVICFLSSRKASYVTGASVNVDGGTSPVV